MKVKRSKCCHSSVIVKCSGDRHPYIKGVITMWCECIECKKPCDTIEEEWEVDRMDGDGD